MSDVYLLLVKTVYLNVATQQNLWETAVDGELKPVYMEYEVLLPW